MKESTKKIYEICDTFFHRSKGAYQRAMKRNNAQIWDDTYNHIKAELMMLEDIAETKTALHRIENTMIFVNDLNESSKNYFKQTKSTL